MQFWLADDPEKKVLHTVLVERNGFIHAMLCGTPLENRDYRYFGQNAWKPFAEGE